MRERKFNAWRRQRNHSAFTLLEILVVLVILGMGMALIITMTTNTTRYSERVEEETFVQLHCENMMNSILAGNMVATIGLELPIPDAPNWSTTVELLDGPIDNLVAIRITAQRYSTIETLNPNNPSAVIVQREPEVGRYYVLKEWARRAEIKTRTIQRDASGAMLATDGSADDDTWRALDEQSSNPLGGATQGSQSSVDPFSAIDAIFDNP